MQKMQHLHFFSCISMLLLYFTICRAFDCEVTYGNKEVAGSIYISKSGRGNFKTIQSAIDSIPPWNSQWIHIRISPGIYHEKVIIPQEKTCVFLEGFGRKFTSIEWDDHEDTAASPTFTSIADNIIVKGITFKNTYNRPMDLMDVNSDNLTQAVAARILGDKSVFYHCAFMGVQDTLWDDQGRHYFHKCNIQGGVDFIFGNGQSIYEKSIIKYAIGDYGANRSYGYITAHRRASADDPSGFVFNRCAVIGLGKVYLGRAWNAFSRVIFTNSWLSEVVEPEGWWAWNNVGNEANITYVEANNVGAGADTSKRVPWVKKLSAASLGQFLNTSFIDKEGWIEKLPIAFK